MCILQTSRDSFFLSCIYDFMNFNALTICVRVGNNGLNNLVTRLVLFRGLRSTHTG